MRHTSGPQGLVWRKLSGEYRLSTTSAGALGRPTWVLLPFAPDWRWLLDREDSPWYPDLRLFRQSRPADWSPVIERVRTALADS